MQTLSETAERLRVVRTAQEKFLSLWALDCLIDERQVTKKLARDIRKADKNAEKHDWSMLYKGSVLDD